MCDFYKNHFREASQMYCTFVQVGFIAHHTDLSEVCVDTDGLYSPRALNECKARRIRGFVCLVMKGEYMTVLFSRFHDTGSHKKKLKVTDMNRFPHTDWGTEVV